MLAALSGFGGMICLGPGFTTGSAPNYSVDGSFSLPATTDFAALGPILWSSTQVSDSDGNLTRNRALFTNTISGAVLPLVQVAAIPTMIAPAGASTGSPAVQFQDRLNPAIIVNGSGATDT